MKPSGEVALETAQRLSGALALSVFAVQVGARLGVEPCPRDRDDVQCSVELAIAAAVQAMAMASAR